MEDFNVKDSYSKSNNELRDENRETIPDQLDTHACLEMRVAELWKKLEETNENLNSCDSMLETYCKVVTEKLNKNICSRCQRQYFTNEEVASHSEIAASENECDAATLMEKLAKSFKNVQSYFYSMTDVEACWEAMEFQSPESQQNSNGMDTVNKFYALLREVFNKMMILEACLEQLKFELLREPSEQPDVESGVRRAQKQLVHATKSFIDVSGMENQEGEGTVVEVKNAAISTDADVVLILSALTICLITADEESNEKQHKREIFGHNLGYSFGHLPYGFGFGNEGHYGVDLGFGQSLGQSFGHSFGQGFGQGFAYGAPLAARVAVAPVARTLGHAPTIHVTHLLSAPIHAPTLSLAAPLTAHVPSEPLKPIIASPLASVVPVPFGLPYPTAIVATKISAAVHIAEPIRAHIAPALSAPITTVKLDVPKVTHAILRPSYHHHH